MLSSSSYFISHRPLALPSLSRIRVSNRPTRFSHLNRSSRVTDFRVRCSKYKWKISCFRQEEIPTENLKPEAIEDILAEELVKPKLDNPKVVKKGWSSNLQELEIDGPYHGQGRLYYKLCCYGLPRFGLWDLG